MLNTVPQYYLHGPGLNAHRTVPPTWSLQVEERCHALQGEMQAWHGTLAGHPPLTPKQQDAFKSALVRFITGSHDWMATAARYAMAAKVQQPAVTNNVLVYSS
jgi:hypothetical protein